MFPEVTYWFFPADISNKKSMISVHVYYKFHTIQITYNIQTDYITIFDFLKSENRQPYDIQHGQLFQYESINRYNSTKLMIYVCFNIRHKSRMCFCDTAHNDILNEFVLTDLNETCISRLKQDTLNLIKLILSNLKYMFINIALNLNFIYLSLSKN